MEGFEDRLLLSGGDPAGATLWGGAATPQNPAENDSAAVEIMAGPAVISVAPIADAAGVSTGASVAATFSTAMDPATINALTFRLLDPSGAQVPAAVSYSTWTDTARLTPVASLAPATTYTAAVKGGPGGVEDSAGNPMAADYSWSFTTATPQPGPAPVVAMTWPAAGAAGVDPRGAITATFNVEMDPKTITADTVQLLDPTGASVPIGVTYGGETATVTITPLGMGLAPGATYSTVIKGGDAGVKSLAGEPMAADYAWSFTTVAQGTGPYSIWSSSAVPGVAADPDTSATEIGVKFRSDVSGYITAIRYYKSSTNTGTHVGSLWDSTGTLLAQATFVNETASGWQQVTFDTPVAITANTVYVASYHTNTGHYAEDDNYFASGGIDNGPLHALANGVDGPNGVYTYSASSAFPTSTYLAANYWVDVVFSQNVWLQTTAADVGAGTQDSTVVTNTSGGEVQLAPGLSDDFNGTALSSSWTSTPWPGATSNVTVSGGILSVAGAQARSADAVLAGTPVESRITIGSATNQQFGLATDLSALAGNSWAVFSTKNKTGTLYAEVNAAGVVTTVSIGSRPTGYHVYRVQPVSTGFQFYVDGVLKTTIAKTIPSGTALKIDLASSNRTALKADWVRLASYASSGTFTSSVFDAGRTVTAWGNATWTADVPAGTTLIIETSSSTDGNTWSDWSAVGNGEAITSPIGRYLKYRVQFTASDPTRTATLYDIAFTWN